MPTGLNGIAHPPLEPGESISSEEFVRSECEYASLPDFEVVFCNRLEPRFVLRVAALCWFV